MDACRLSHINLHHICLPVFIFAEFVVPRLQLCYECNVKLLRDYVYFPGILFLIIRDELCYDYLLMILLFSKYILLFSRLKKKYRMLGRREKKLYKSI
jgi:hypothetical protein